MLPLHFLSPFPSSATEPPSRSSSRRLPTCASSPSPPHSSATEPPSHFSTQRLLTFSTRTLSTLPPPDAASTAKPDGLALLEAVELQESTSDHQKAFDLSLKALGSLQECHNGWSLPVARALHLTGAAPSCPGLLSDSLESLNAVANIVDSLDGCRVLGNVADIWLPWDRGENGEVDKEMLWSGTRPELGEEDEQDDNFIVDWDTSELDDVVDDIVATKTKVFGGATTMSAFADEDIVDGVLGLGLNGDDMFWSSDDEDEDGYL